VHATSSSRVRRARASRSRTIHYKINDDVCGFHPVLYATLQYQHAEEGSGMVAQKCTPTSRPQRVRSGSAVFPQRVRSASAVLPQRAILHFGTTFCKFNLLMPDFKTASSLVPRPTGGLGTRIHSKFPILYTKRHLYISCVTVVLISKRGRSPASPQRNLLASRAS